MEPKVLSKTIVWSSIGLALLTSMFAAGWARSETETVAFPDSYLVRERPSIFFDGNRNSFTDELFYDLVIEGIVDFIVIKNRRRSPASSQESDGSGYIKLTKAPTSAECIAAAQPRGLRVLSSVWRSNYDLLRGKCVIVQPGNQSDTDLRLLEDSNVWSFEERSSGTTVARVTKTSGPEAIRTLFGARANISQQPGSPVFDDDFSDVALARAIRSGGHVTAAAITVIRLRVSADDRGLVPEISVRRTVSPDLLEQMLQLASVDNDPGQRFLPGFRALIPGASAQTAERIFPKMIEMLYAPFKASKPYGPWFYGNRWKEQVQNKRPDLEKEFTRNNYVPVFAAADSFRSASALALHLGPPYTGLFYEEFSTEIVNRVLSNTGPSFYTAILAQSEPNLLGVISELRGRTPSPNRIGTLWALIEQGKSLPGAFIEDLRKGCEENPEFLNNAHASQRYLDGNSFCTHFFESDTAKFRH